jgi:probable phosphoglycerate mutase
MPFRDLNGLAEWKTYNAFRSISAAPGGESLRDVQQRTIDALLKLHSLQPDRTSIIVTHADVIRAAVTFFCGAPLDLYLRLRIDPASVSIVELSKFGAQIHCVNRIT